ncbi:hypothetical protein [Luteolibacter pohnpeiensis]|nr:hypothetical protein [Luteolibacter pohnpeiensis]
MKSLKIPLLLAVSLPLLLISCNTEKLAKKREEQKAEIARLNGELKLVKEQIKSLPPDHTNELAAARDEEKDQLDQIQALDSQVSELESKKDQLDEEFKKYRAKYVVK